MRLLLLLLLLAGCEAGPSADQCDDLSPHGWDSADASFEVEVLEETNAARAMGRSCNGVDLPPVDPVTTEDRLQCAARLHAIDMATNDFFAHDSPTTGSVADRVDEAGYEWGVVSENLAAGRPDAAATVGDWLTSTTGHCENLMDGDVVHGGMALVRSETAEFPTYWVQVFARPL